jgi:hypothetical protein
MRKNIWTRLPRWPIVPGKSGKEQGMQRKSADDLFLFIGERFHSNSTIFLHGRRALVVEGTASREDGFALKRFVEEDLGAEAILLLSTHYFSDHLAAWSLFPKAAIVAQASYRETFDREAFRSEEERSLTRASATVTSTMTPAHTQQRRPKPSRS